MRILKYQVSLTRATLRENTEMLLFFAAETMSRYVGSIVRVLRLSNHPIVRVCRGRTL
jgi:hypothetical protein